jgi:uncharacterized protein YbgA (DUF1722 family)/uncharacterized protein YbbK (DUF523 family)
VSGEDFARPRLVVSRCLGFAACRWDGSMLRDRFVAALADHCEIITVCPEEEMGMGTPRAPVRIVQQAEDGPRRLLQQDTGTDWTPMLERWVATTLPALGEVDGFLLKNRSPSCAVKDARVYPRLEPAPARGSGPGLFAEAARSAHPHAAFEDEGRLSNDAVRHHFLSRVFTTARFRAETRRSPSMATLVRFQARHKYLIMSHSQKELRILGRLVANPDRRSAAAVAADYGEHLDRALERPARLPSTVNVLEHCYGYVRRRLGEGERRHFRRLLSQYRARALPLSALLVLLQSWIVRFEVDYLDDQAFFRPYPEALMDLATSAKGRGGRFSL